MVRIQVSMPINNLDASKVQPAIDGAFTRFLTRSMLSMHKAASEPGIVPIDTGLLRASMAPGAGVTAIDSANPPKWARVGTNVPYGGALDNSSRGEPHYRGGPSAGDVTRGWLKERAWNASADEVSEFMIKMIHEIYEELSS